MFLLLLLIILNPNKERNQEQNFVVVVVAVVVVGLSQRLQLMVKMNLMLDVVYPNLVCQQRRA